MSRALGSIVFAALIGLAGLAAFPSPVTAKEGVVARVLTPIPRDAQPGTKLTVVWTLSSVDKGKRHPFGGGASSSGCSLPTGRAPGGYSPSQWTWAVIERGPAFPEAESVASRLG